MERRFLIGIGPGKSGSTWLYTFLRASTEISCSKIKETGYFSSVQNVEESEYLNVFFPDEKNKNIFCEVSNTYIFDPAASSQFAKIESKIDLITILRDPVERAISHVHQLIRNGEKFDSFESALYRRPDILARGLYASYLNNYTDLPAHVTLNVFCFNELVKNEEKFKQRLCKTLSLNPSAFEDVESRQFSRSAPRSRLIAAMVKKMAVLFRHVGLTSVIQRVKDSPIPHLLYAPSTDNSEILPKKETLVFMRKFFYLADLELARQWGVDVSEWQSQASDA